VLGTRFVLVEAVVTVVDVESMMAVANVAAMAAVVVAEKSLFFQKW